jgi:DNA (cytosine-5)-methyltransferase 1
MEKMLNLKIQPVTRVADLFCGAGGLGLGFRSQGFDIVWAVDAFSAAVETYKKNIGDHIEEAKLDWNTVLPSCDIIIGGPPCQGFSSAGLRKPGDARNTLVAVFAHLVARHRPKAFVFENVEGFLTGEGGRWVTDLLDPLVGAGYCIHLRKVNAANYGVPQHRKRVLAIGGLGWDPGFPEATHRATGAPGADLVAGNLPWCESVASALDGLPPAAHDPETALVSDHYFRPPNEMDRLRFEALGAGQTMKDIPEHLWHETYRRRAFRRVMDGTPTERRGGAPSGLRRLEPSFPSKAITSGATSEFVHPTEHRNLTLRECARLQTFPDTFEFAGTQAQRALLIGNAVPPRFASAIAAHLANVVGEMEERSSDPGLKSFVPTNSTGMSPALQKTVDSVESRYRSVARSRQIALFSDAEAAQAGHDR